MSTASATPGRMTGQDHPGPFVPGNIYRRRDLHRDYGGQDTGGISTPARYPFIMLFTGEGGKAFGYHDGWTPDGQFHYTGEGQLGDMTFVRGNRAIRDHVHEGKTLHLFSTTEAGAYYIGQMVYEGHQLVRGPDRSGHDRQVILFTLVPVGQTVPGPSDAPPAPPSQEEDLETRAGWLALSPVAFEHAAARLLRFLGYDEVTVTKPSGDGGIDLIATRGQERFAGQCKRCRGSVNPRDVQALAGVIALDPAQFSGGIFLTTGHLTPQTLRVAELAKIQVYTGTDLVTIARQMARQPEVGNDHPEESEPGPGHGVKLCQLPSIEI
jgi:hypothetical protein